MFYLPPVTGQKFHHIPLSLAALGHALGQGEHKFARNPEFAGYRTYEKGSYEFAKASLIPAIKAAATAGIPAETREQAERYSRELVFTLSTFRSRVVRDRAHGALDSSKLARLASPGISRREFDRLAGSAFKHREHTKAPNTRPRVAIVADTCHDIRTAEPDYMTRVGTLAYVLGEAARIAGVDVGMFHCRGTLWEVGAGNIGKLSRATGAPFAKPLHIVTHAVEFGAAMTPESFYIATSDPAFVQVLRATTGHYNKNNNGMGSRNGAGGVEYARLQGAQLVVAIGEFPGDTGADITLSPKSDIAACVAAIVAHMNERKAA